MDKALRHFYAHLKRGDEMSRGYATNAKIRLKPDTDDFTQSFLDYDSFLNLFVDQTCDCHIPERSKPKRHKPSLASPPLPMVPALSPTP